MEWISADIKPEGCEREVLVWVEWPECGRPTLPEFRKAWWKHGPCCFAFDKYENANHLVKFWMDVVDPTDYHSCFNCKSKCSTRGMEKYKEFYCYGHT
jgi:hypothetical protein